MSAQKESSDARAYDRFGPNALNIENQAEPVLQPTPLVPRKSSMEQACEAANVEENAEHTANDYGISDEMQALAQRIRVKCDDGTIAPFCIERIAETLATHTNATQQQATDIVVEIMQSIPLTIDADQLEQCILKRFASNIDCEMQRIAGQYDYYLLQKEVGTTNYLQACERLYGNVTLNGEPAARLHKRFMEFVRAHHLTLQHMLDEWEHDTRRKSFNFFAMQTMRRTYLMRVASLDARGKFVERCGETPEQMYMRVAIVVTNFCISEVPNTFQLLAGHKYTHASPTLFNSGAPIQQLASCFLLNVEEDSIAGIYDTVKKCAVISKTGGGIGLNIQTVRSIGSEIKTGGTSNGIVPMLKVFEATTSYVSQNNKRRGSCAAYVHSWNKQMMDFTELRLNVGAEANRTRDLFTAVVLNDLFMERVHQDGRWTMFCVSKTPDLQHLFGPAFTARYLEYEAEKDKHEGLTMSAQTIWLAIVKSMQATGTPYCISMSNMNKSQHTHMFGANKAVTTSNLCAEIMQFTGKDEDNNEEHVAVCNLATIKLDSFVLSRNKYLGTSQVGSGQDFDWTAFGECVRTSIRNLDNTVDLSYYPTECAKRMNLKVRPLGLGIQGLADLFMVLNMPFNSPEALKLDRDIAEFMYYQALSESMELAKTRGPYELFWRSPASKRILQFDMYNETEKVYKESVIGETKWEQLKTDIVAHGLRNSLLIAHPPTASTASVMQSVECFEPMYQTMYARKTSVGVTPQICKYLYQVLKKRGLWTKETRDLLIKDRGSLERIPLTAHEREVFKSAFDMSMRKYIDHAIARSRFICQSQSLNLFWKDPKQSKITSAIFYGWRKGLKTMSYYIRRRPKVEVHQFGGISEEDASRIASKLQRQVKEVELASDDDEGCLMCGS
ncbi:ribonucleoside-diphosphate reductase subunit alpha [bacterium]|nr:ribonucleoside-diphosphate reductase subunit alpha [bacterium]